MSFIGIITESKKEIELKQILKKYFESVGHRHTIMTINDKNIDNIKNVKFDAIILDSNILDEHANIEKFIINAKVVVVNTDSEDNLNCVKNLKLRLISYGLNPKATVTISSIDEEKILVTLQRAIKTLSENIIEPQEIEISLKGTHNNPYISMILVIFSIIFDKN